MPGIEPPSPPGRGGLGGEGAPRLRILTVCAVLVLAASQAAPARVGFFFVTEWVTGDFGSGQSGDLAAVAAGFSVERAVRFSVEVPVVRAREAPALVRTRVGTAPTRREAAAQPAPRWEEGLGDVRLALAVPLAGRGAQLFRLDAEVEAKAPTADEDLLLGTGEWDYKVALLGEYELWSAVLFGGVGHDWLGDPRPARGRPLPPEFEDVFEAFFGVESETFSPRWRWAVWLEGHEEVVAGAGERLALGLGLRSVGDTGFRLSATVGLSDAAEDVGILLGLDFNPRPRPGKRP